MARRIRGASTLGAVLIAGAMIGLACSSSNNNKGTVAPPATAAKGASGSPAAASSATAITTIAPPTQATGGQPTGKQEFRVNLGGEPDSIDPSKSSFDLELTVDRQLFRGLLTFDKDLNVIPDVAAQVPSKQNGGISADGLTYTFKLKPNYQWSDGKPLLANDFVYALKREVTPGVGGDYADFFTGSIKGADKLADLKPDDPSVKALVDGIGVSAPDAGTLKIELQQPNSVFIQYMELSAAYPLRQDVIEKFGDKWTEAGNLVGDGPFLLKEWQHKDHITLVRNDKYSGADKPKLDTIQLKMIPDSQQAYNDYIAGNLETAGVPSPLVKTVDNDPTLKKENVRYTRADTFYLTFNVTKAPFDNKKVRQAFSSAVDRDALVNSIYQGINKPAYSMIPPGFPGFDQEVGTQFKLDPAKAKQTLTDAGFPNAQGLPKVTLTYSEGGTNPAQAEFLKEQFSKNLGVDLQLEQVDTKSFQARVKAKDYQLIFSGWGADYPDAESMMSPNFKSSGGNNKSFYSNKDFDALMGQGLAETDPGKHTAIYQQAQKLMVDDAPVLFLFWAEGNSLRKPYLKGVISTPFGTDYFWTQIYLQH